MQKNGPCRLAGRGRPYCEQPVKPSRERKSRVRVTEFLLCAKHSTRHLTGLSYSSLNHIRRWEHSRVQSVFPQHPDYRQWKPPGKRPILQEE